MSMMLETSESFDDAWEDDLGDGEDDAEYENGEMYDEATSRRRRRARQLELARRRRARTAAGMRRRAAAPATPPAARTAAAIRALELENSVQDDAFRAALAAQQRRQSRSEAAAVVAVVSKQVQDSFQNSVDLLQNPLVKAGLTASPLFLLAPQRKGDGLGRYLTDPRVIGTALVLGLAFFGEQQDRADLAADIRVSNASEITDGDDTIILAEVLDRKGRVLQGKNVVFTTDRPDLVDIDANGRVTTKAPGLVVVNITVDNVTRRTVLNVRARAQQQQAASAKAA
jgi:hypothetical protein